MRVTIPEAAERLGVSIDTVRRRLRSGKLTGDLVEGRWQVDMPDPVHTEDAGGLTDPRDLVIELLREQLTARTREVQELHVLLAQAHPAKPTPWWRRLLPGPSEPPQE